MTSIEDTDSTRGSISGEFATMDYKDHDGDYKDHDIDYKDDDDKGGSGGSLEVLFQGPLETSSRAAADPAPLPPPPLTLLAEAAWNKAGVRLSICYFPPYCRLLAM